MAGPLLYREGLVMGVVFAGIAAVGSSESSGAFVIFYEARHDH